MCNLASYHNWVAVAILAGTLAALGAPQGILSVGAARVDITPPADAVLPMAGYAGRTHRS
jgi:hypothetical protein